MLIGVELLILAGLFVWLYNSPQISPLWMGLELGLSALFIAGIGFKLYKRQRTRHALQQNSNEQAEKLQVARKSLLNQARQTAAELLPLLGMELNANQSLSDDELAALFDNYSLEQGRQMQTSLEAWQRAVRMLIRLQEINNQLVQLEQAAWALSRQLLLVDASNPSARANIGNASSQLDNVPSDFLSILAGLENSLNQSRRSQLEQNKVKGQLAGYSGQQLEKHAELQALQQQLSLIYNQANVRNLEELETMHRLWQEKLELENEVSKLENELLENAQDIFKNVNQVRPNRAAAAVRLQDSAWQANQDSNPVQGVELLLQNILPTGLAAVLPQGVRTAPDLLTIMQIIPRENLVQEFERLNLHAQDLEEQVREKTKQQGALQQQASALISEDRLSALAFEESALQEELHGLSRKWAVAALTQHFLLQAKAAFEQEHQTAVMSGASKYFKQITNGVYEGLDPSAEAGSFAVLTRQGESRLPEQLSRGTREQLYLALRLALIEDRDGLKLGQPSGSGSGQSQLPAPLLPGLAPPESVQIEPLPLIMDDVLVNFDPHRAKRSVQSILTLASRHQIFYFTCQPHMLPLLCEQAEMANCSYKCFNLREGRVSPA